MGCELQQGLEVNHGLVQVSSSEVLGFNPALCPEYVNESECAKSQRKLSDKDLHLKVFDLDERASVAYDPNTCSEEEAKDVINGRARLEFKF